MLSCLKRCMSLKNFNSSRAVLDKDRRNKRIAVCRQSTLVMVVLPSYYVLINTLSVFQYLQDPCEHHSMFMVKGHVV